MSVADMLKTKRTERETLKNQVVTLRTQMEAAEKEGKNTGEDRTKLNTMVDTGVALTAEIHQLENELAMSKSLPVDEGTATSMARNGGFLSQGRKSVGQLVVESKQFKANNGRELEPVKIGSIPGAIGGRKAIYETTDATGGAAVPIDQQLEIVDIVRQRPLRVIDLINRSRTTLDTVSYPRYTARTNNAAIKSEYTAGNFGIVTASDMTFDLLSATVQTLVAFVPASVQILQDAPRLSDLIDNDLVYQIELLLEDQALNGDGTGNNFDGLNHVSGTQARVHAVSGARFDSADNRLDTIRRAITDLALDFYIADGIIVNPATGEELELEKDDIGQYLKMYDSVSARVWRVPVVETAGQTAGTATVGAFKLAATLWDRMDSQVLTGQPNDYFLRLAWAVLAYLRAAFAVQRPLAIEVVTGL